jgi:ubiquinol-cytochrome c reductase cytochrome b subunit
MMNPLRRIKERIGGALSRTGAWLDRRLRLESLYAESIGHLIPRSSASWWYVLGSGTLVCFILQIVTGICLSLVYVPSASEAYASLEYLNYQQTLGWFLRAVHYWGSNFMVALITLHMIQVFLFGAYKYPRELTWIIGCVLFLLTLGAAFTGQIMRFDQDAYWGLGIGVSIMGRVPVVGQELMYAVLGGPIIGGETLTRFFALHVFLIPGLLIGLIYVHLRLVLKLGINEYPVPGEKVDPATYEAKYDALIEREGIRFFPDGIHKDLFFAAFVLLAILFCSVLFGPKMPNGAPDPTLINTAPRPDFYFLSLFAVLALMPPAMEDVFILVILPVLFGVLFLVPFLSNRGEKHPSRRPVAVIAVVLVMMTLVSFAYLGVQSPWSPHMDAWSGLPIPEERIRPLSPVALRGASVFQVKQCRNCHAIDGSGGRRGPELGDVATRLTRDQLIRQVLQGGGNMPAYGKHLDPAETTALVAFLETLRPQASARPSEAGHTGHPPEP